MMKWGLGVLTPNWLLEETKSGKWTEYENKLFEDALALHDRDSPDRWHKVAAMIPGKTVVDVIKQYKELVDDVSDIEAGIIAVPDYSTSSFTLEWVNDEGGFDGLKQSYGAGLKRTSSARPSEHERKKGVPWTEDEHKLFLLGLKKYGKGDWRNISRNYVRTRTPTQVASHAQKYFIRQHSGGKDKRRSSIHDITTVNLTDNKPSSPEQEMLCQQPNQSSVAKAHFDWSQPQNRGSMVFGPTHGNLFMPPSYEITSYGMKLQGQHLHKDGHHGSHVGAQRAHF